MSHLTHAIDLQPFCGTDEFRPYLHAPFNYGDHTYAMDGRILIRVARRAGLAEKPKTLLQESFDKTTSQLESRWLDSDALFAQIPEYELLVWPAEPCGDCSGSGLIDQDQCDWCDGSGNFRDEMHIARFPDQDFNLRYIDLINDLPEVVLAFGANDCQPAVFRFDGGVGCVMPMRRDLIPLSCTSRGGVV